MPQLPASDTIIFAALATTLLVFVLYLREYFLRKKVYEDQKRILETTRQKSAQLLAASEEAQTQAIAQTSFAAKALIQEFEAKLQNIFQTSENSIASSQDLLIKFMDDLKKQGERQINELFERLETKLADFLVATEQKTTSSIELELKSTRQLIEAYKNEQLKLIDENIIAMMEQTLNIVLGKKLSLKDQLDLVYEALEKAKVEKFVV